MISPRKVSSLVDPGIHKTVELELSESSQSTRDISQENIASEVEDAHFP